MAGRYDERVRDLLTDATEASARGDWAAVRDLAGAALALSPSNPDAQRLLQDAGAAAPTSGERRQLTVMFCDVVGSTQLSQQRDPELVGEVLRRYQVTCDGVVRSYDGRIARYVGDGVLAYFGHPVPHEDDARRGVKAGLDLLEALRPVTEEVRARYDIDLRIRVAVHTGLVVLSDMGSAATPDRDAIVGDTPNVAARLQDHAAPGTLIISHDTYALVRGWFQVAPVGPLELRGVARPVRAYQVVEEAEEQSRIANADLSPFVGRADELADLVTAWDEVAAGGSRTLALTGPPGVGKSRLADVLCRRVQAGEGTALVAQCSTFHRATVLHPARRLVERAAGIDTHQDPELALSRLWSTMDALGQADALPYVADLLQLPPTSWCPAPELEGARLREQLLTTMAGWITAAATRGPLLLVVDDLQWADPTTIELLGNVVRAQVPGLLLLVTARDDAKVPWSDATVLGLDRLSGDELADLARRLPEGRSLAAGDLERAIERSDGIPLFLEELVRSSALVHGDGSAPGAAIPAALRDLLLARFAAPGVDLRLAQVLATIGIEVTLPLLAAVSKLDPLDLDVQVGALVDAGIVTLLPGDPLVYRYRHQLLADLAYDTQLQGARQAAHGQVADALLAGHGSGAAAGPAVLAHHLEHAGRIADAALALTEAAEVAHGLGANAEVHDLLERAFALLDRVEPDRRSHVEFEVRLLRGISVSSIMGYAAPPAVDDFAACRELVGEVTCGGYLDEEMPERAFQELVWAATGLWATFMLTGKLDAAHQVNRSITHRLRPGGEQHELFDSTRALIDLFEGAYGVGVPGLVRNAAAMRRVDMSGRASVPGDPAVASMAHLAFGLAAQCRFDEAIAVADEATELAGTLPYPRGPFSFCYVSSVRAGIQMISDDIAGARRTIEQVAATADRHGFTFWSLIAGYYLAVIEMHEGVEGAGDRARGTIALLQALGMLVWLPTFFAAISAAHLRRGEVEASRGALRDAAEVADQTGAHLWSAEIARQEGEVAIALGEAGGLERLREAVALAQQQDATLLELWARTSLCRHSDDPADTAALAALLDRLPPGASAIEPEVVGARRAGRARLTEPRISRPRPPHAGARGCPASPGGARPRGRPRRRAPRRRRGARRAGDPATPPGTRSRSCRRRRVRTRSATWCRFAWSRTRRSGRARPPSPGSWWTSGPTPACSGP